MRSLIRNTMLFAAGIIVGAFLMQPSPAQQSIQPAKSTGLRLNHVGIYAKDYDESMRFYTQTIGLKEAFTIKDAAGKPTLTYLHITKDTFLEISPATAERPVGLSHVGIWPENLTASVAVLRQRGVQVADPRTSATLSSITNVTDPNGIRLEFLDFLAGSTTRKAIDDWK